MNTEQMKSKTERNLFEQVGAQSLDFGSQRSNLRRQRRLLNDRSIGKKTKERMQREDANFVAQRRLFALKDALASGGGVELGARRRQRSLDVAQLRRHRA